MATQKRLTMQPTPHDIESEGLPSASGFDAEFRCPGKRALCAKLPKEKETAITNRGQRIHDSLAAGDFSELAKSDETTASRIAYGEGQIVHEYGFEGAQIEFEVRFWDIDDGLNHLWSARVDRHDWQPDKRRLLVIDDKTGWGVPPPVHTNWQIRSEAALLAEQYDALEVIAALIHPHHPDSLWEARVYDRIACDHLLAVVRHGVTAIQMPDQRRIVGGIQCQWCMAKRVCPEYKAADEALDIAIADEIQDQGFTAINRRTKEERGEHVRQLKEKAKNVEFILAQYTELMERDNEAIAGWRLARKLTRKVTDEAQAMELVKGEYGAETLYSCLTFSIKALEDQLAKQGTRKDAKAAVERVLAPILRFDKSRYYLEEARSI
jgi:hypothetical protein